MILEWLEFICNQNAGFNSSESNLKRVSDLSMTGSKVSIDPVSSRSEHSTERLLFFLILFGGIAIFFDLGGRAAENKDYLVYPEVAREILEFGDWIMLRHEGQIYVHKPPLHFWLIAGSYNLFGVSPFAARMPSALAALAGLLMAFFFGRKLFQNSETGFLAALMLLSSFGYFWWARRTRIDMQYAVFFSLALIFFYYGLQASSNRRKAIWYMAYWLATGCAFMDKAFIALANLIVVIAYSAVVGASKNDERKVSPLLLLATSPCLALPILPWVIALLRHPDFSAYWTILQQTKIMTRQEGFFYYFKEFPFKLFPAVPFFFMGVWTFFRHRQEIPQRRGLEFLLVWIGTQLLLLHLTAAKNHRYLLPIFIPCALVSAWAVKFYLKKTARTMSSVLRRVNDAFFGLALFSLVIPFVFAFYSDISLLKPFPYVVALFIGFIIAWKALPLKVAGFCIGFVVLLLAIEVGDAARNDQTADYYRTSQMFRAEGVSATEIAFHPCSNRYRVTVSFYYDKLMYCSDNLNEIATDPKFRVVVAAQQAIDALISKGADKTKLGRIYDLNKGYVAVIKPKNN
jgi:4-amino-4-deoxy-L-arabinose transferase-like glycosyltransferase